MKKKAFINIYILILLLILSIVIGFSFEQTKNEADLNKDLYNKKIALYEAESVMNIFLADEDQVGILVNEYFYSKNPNNYNGFKNRVKVFNEEYNGKNFEINLYKNDSYLELAIENQIEDSIANAKTRIRRIEEFDINSEEIIYYDFFDDINFIEGSSKKILGSDLKDEDFLEEILEIVGNFEINSNKKITKNYFEGIMIINGDIILEKDFEIDGLLIIKGDIYKKENKEDDESIYSNESHKTYKKDDNEENLEENIKPKLIVNGQIISKNILDKNLIEYSFDKDLSKDKILSIKDIVDYEILLERVY